jgi:HlyD family secretion protein
MQDIKVPATLEYISPEGVEQNGVTKFEVWAAVNIPEGIDVRSGYSVNARVVTEEHKGVLSIDEASVVFDADSAFVYRLTSSPEDLSSQEWERIPVKVGISNGIYVEILQGVNAEEHLRGIKK